ncbi:YncE family protein [Granulicella sp. dw_53]|uniref:YncE family protein n=1 Tax=Granulicella sp. dw_53 TaxID=2719792 RepID=UPI001BD42027|nr:YncE family protein [Granulicella sp. dw_53]
MSRHSRSRKLLFSLAALGSLAILCPPSLHGQSQYHIIDRWKIGGEGSWDYLLADGPAHRLYVTHNARVEVLDIQTGKVIGAVTGMKSTHGVALDADGKIGYISDGAGNAVVVFDRSNLQTLATIPVGTNPDGIAFEPSTHTVWAFNGRSKNVSVVDATSRQIVATISLPGKPEFPAVDGRGAVYVNIEDKNEIVKMDARTKKVLENWPLAGCESPSGLAFDIPGHRLFSVCDGGKMAVTDSLSGKVLATPTIGDSPDAAGFDARYNVAFSSNGGDATLSVVDTSSGKYPTTQTLKTAKGARTMTLDPGTGRLYLVTAEFGPTPAATVAVPHPRPAVIPGSFTVLVIGR